MNKQNEKELNWSWIGAIGLAVVVLTYIGISSRATTLSLQFKNERLAELIKSNDNMQKYDCDLPLEKVIGELQAAGRDPRWIDAMEFVDSASAKRCDDAKMKIAQNKVEAAHLSDLAVPMSYYTSNFFKTK